jgi:hypothetical protein
MIWHLIAAVFAGLGAAGIALLLRFISRRKLPRWIVPVFAGMGMLGYQIHTEYTWFDTKRSRLPESARVVDLEHGSMLWRPWTFAFPMPVAFEVVDRENRVATRADDQRLVEFMLYRFEKQNLDRVVHQAFLMNCSTRELVPMGGEERRPRFSEMRRLDASDPLVEAVCDEA